ncbi:MAG: hypothetical protein JW812_01570 [Alphaproteobacteria bacterium]|nr:hypothetical protein [Alphaproteobacteria bacterium]
MAISRLFDGRQRDRICLIKTVEKLISREADLIEQEKEWPTRGDHKYVIEKIEQLKRFVQDFDDAQSILYSKIEKLKSFRSSFLAHYLEKEKTGRIIINEVGYLIRKAESVVGMIHFCVLEASCSFEDVYEDSFRETQEHIARLKQIL